jgi:hypothetical protein
MRSCDSREDVFATAAIHPAYRSGSGTVRNGWLQLKLGPLRMLLAMSNTAYRSIIGTNWEWQRRLLVRGGWAVGVIVVGVFDPVGECCFAQAVEA